MDKQTLQLMYQGNLQNVEKGRTNRSFTSATLRLLAVDVVANKTKYSKESILKALPTLRNIPIVGLLKGDDFGSHEAQMVLDEEVGLKTVYNTVPFGLIPESANFWFETANVNGKEQEFLCVDVLLWKRQKEVNVLAKRKQFNTSMEVTILSGHKDRSGVLHIYDFYFTAVCVLGNHIAPAFKGAQIQTYSEDTDIQDKINQMMMDFAKQLGGEMMDKDQIKETPEQEEKQPETVENESADEKKEKTPEDETYTTCQTKESDEEYKDKDAIEDDEEETPASDEETTPIDEPVDKEGESDEEEQPVDDQKDEEEDQVAKATYEALVGEHQALKDALTEKEEALAQLQTSYDELKQKTEELETFKSNVLAEQRRQAEEQLFASFNELADLSEFEALKQSAHDYTLEALETQLYALMGRKCRTQKQYSNSVNVAYEATYQASNPTDSVFGLLDSYLKK